jgi:hypothetical protein
MCSQTCIKRSPLGQRKIDLIRQVTSLKRFNAYDIFYHRTRKRWPFNTGDCLIEVTAWAGLTVFGLWELNSFIHGYNKINIKIQKLDQIKTKEWTTGTLI